MKWILEEHLYFHTPSFLQFFSTIALHCFFIFIKRCDLFSQASTCKSMFFYTHISFHRNWSDFSQALSKARDTKQINVSEVIIYQKTLSAIAATMYWSIFWGSIAISWDILFRSNAKLFQLTILCHVHLNVYLPTVKTKGHFGHRDIFGWSFGWIFG